MTYLALWDARVAFSVVFSLTCHLRINLLYCFEEFSYFLALPSLSFSARFVWKMSSIATSSPASIGANRTMKGNLQNNLPKKRSISSTIMGLFRSDMNNRDDESDSNAKRYKFDISSSSQVMHQDHEVEDPKFAGSIILYESEDNSRPPFLPILPIQRLRLLRQKQKLKQQMQFKQLNVLDRSKQSDSNTYVTLPESVDINDESSIINNDTVIYHKSSTPSPIKTHSNRRNIKNTSISNIRLKSLPNNKPNKLIGSKWSGEFVYDLSEVDYLNDTKDNEKIDETGTKKNIKISSIPLLLTNEPKMDDKLKNNLTSTQRDLLLNGVKQSNVNKNLKQTDSVRKISINAPISESKNKDNSAVLLPTVGFDFIKNNDTPSKKSSPLSKTIGCGIDKCSEEATTKSKFTFSAPTSNIKTVMNDSLTEKKTELPKLSFNLPNTNPPLISTPTPLSTSNTSLFNPNKKVSVSSDEANEENEPKRKKRSQTGVTINMTQDSGKPIFSFGASSGTGEPQKSKPAFTFGLDKGKTEKEDKKLPEVSTSKPAFSFGSIAPTGTDVAEKTKSTSFSFGAKKVDDAEKNKPAFSFGSSTIKTSDTDVSQTNSGFTFGAQKDLKQDENKLTVQPNYLLPKTGESNLSSNESSVSPSFSLTKSLAGQDSSSETPKPSLTFGDANNEKAQNGANKRKFTFNGASSDASTSTSTIPSKPAFNFGQSLGAVNESAIKSTTPPSFTFGQNGAEGNKEVNKHTPLFVGNNNTLSAASESSMPNFGFGQQQGANKLPVSANSNPPSSGFTFTKAPATLESSTIGSVTLGAANTNSLLGNNNGAPKLFSPPPSSFNFGASSAPDTMLRTGNTNPLLSNNLNTSNFNHPSNNNPDNGGGSVFQMGGVANASSFNMGPQNMMGSNNMAPQSTFNPSTTPNINFGNSTANPSSIFTSSGPSVSPQQIFGNAPNTGMTTSNTNLRPQRDRVYARMRGPRR